MKSFNQYITEGKYPPRVKGWGNVNTGKLALTLIKGKWKPYHQEFAARNLNKLGLKEKDAIKYLDDAYTPPTANHTKRLWKNIQDGKIDKDKAFEEFLNKNGWYSIVIDEGTSSIGDYKGGPRKYHKIAVAIDKEYGDSMFQSAGDFFEVGIEDIDNKYDWDNYIKTKKIGGGGRTEIGRTMAQFREEKMKSFKQYITEKPAKLSGTLPYKGAGWKDFRGLENPNEREIRALMKKSKFKELRFVVDSKGRMWAWDTEDALHDEVVFAMTGQKYVGDYAKGMISFINPDDEDDYMAVPDGNLHVTVLNTRTVGDDFALKNKTMKALAKRINSKGKDRVWWAIA